MSHLRRQAHGGDSHGTIVLHETIDVDELCLVVLEGPAAGRSIMLDQESLLIGRSEWCDLCLKDSSASSSHMEIRLTERGVRLRDLDSKNGVSIGDTKVLDAYIKPGTVLRVGRSLLELRLADEKKRKIEIKYEDDSGLLVGKSQEMRELFSYLKRLARHDLNLLLTGETGTGKSYMAQALHEQSSRKGAPFVTVNCGALPDGLIESELFGYEKGAHNTAFETSKGVFEQASGGTLFLDEIGELPIGTQSKLLDAVQRKKIRRLGGDREIDVDVRLIAATNRELGNELAEGTFRNDLYHRLAEMELEIPPLRERREDIPLLVEKILGELSPERPIYVASDAMKVLQMYPWSGNVRELKNVLKRSYVMCDSAHLTADDLFFHASPKKMRQARRGSALPPMMPSSEPGDELPLYADFAQNKQEQNQLLGLDGDVVETADKGFSFDDYVTQLKRIVLQQAYDAHDGSAAKVAKALGKSRSWTYDQLNFFKIREK